MSEFGPRNHNPDALSHDMASQCFASTLAAAPVAGLARRSRAPAARARPARRSLTIAAASATEKDDEALASESAGAKKRDEESKAAGIQERRPPRGGEAPPPGKWEWTLNWDPVVYDEVNAAPLTAPTKAELDAAGCVIGSCPRTPSDVDRLIDEGGVEAIICLQCELCHGALMIDWEPIRARALERGVPIVRVSVRDFDRLDQAKMLPEVRAPKPNPNSFSPASPPVPLPDPISPPIPPPEPTDGPQARAVSRHG